MKIVITTRKPVFDDQLGRLKEGDIVDLVDHKANFYIQRGEAMSYQTKVLQDRPLVGAGTVEQSSALHQAPAYATKTLNESVDGEKKRGRKPKQSS